jgi:polynucleotide 5'-kinase involved in rRNA processing
VEGKENNALIWQRRAENLLVGLYDQRKKFLGIGILREVDYTRKAIKVFTAVEEKPAVVFFGKMRLDEYWHEIQEKPVYPKVNV